MVTCGMGLPHVTWGRWTYHGCQGRFQSWPQKPFSVTRQRNESLWIMHFHLHQCFQTQQPYPICQVGGVLCYVLGWVFLSKFHLKHEIVYTADSNSKQYTASGRSLWWSFKHTRFNATVLLCRRDSKGAHWRFSLWQSTGTLLLERLQSVGSQMPQRDPRLPLEKRGFVVWS